MEEAPFLRGFPISHAAHLLRNCRFLSKCRSLAKRDARLRALQTIFGCRPNS